MPSKLLKNGTVLSFDEQSQTIKTLSPASILIANDRISAITQKSDELDLPSDTEEVDVSGKVSIR